VEIRLRLANVKLLAFGPTLSHRITQRDVVDGDKTSINQSAGQVQTIHCTVMILPMTRVVLPLPSSVVAPGARRGTSKDRGALSFSR
jgi:hypothetical protein